MIKTALTFLVIYFSLQIASDLNKDNLRDLKPSPKKIPVTFINYFSEKIKTDSKNSYSKYDIIENAKNGNPYEPKSTKHLIYCEEELDWFPITLISTLFNLKLN